MSPKNTMIYKATSPSNIALMKYWGKKDPVKGQHQGLAYRDSLSMTLSECVTITTAEELESSGSHSFYFEDRQLFSSDNFAKKVFAHLNFLDQYWENPHRHFRFRSRNTFPSGAGIASSASGLSALTMAYTAALFRVTSFEALQEKGVSRERLAWLSWWGSGSAARSLFPGFVQWHTAESVDLQKFESLFPADHWDLTDIVCLFQHQKSKSVSSSDGHKFAVTSPLFTPHLSGSRELAHNLRQAIAERSLKSMGPLIETEALLMHAVMLSGQKCLDYVPAESWNFVEWLRKERILHGMPAYFTIDAGPNIHVICESKDRHFIEEKIKNAFPTLRYIVDKIGTGPSLQGDSEI